MTCKCSQTATHILNDIPLCKECLIKTLGLPISAKIIPLEYIEDVKQKVCVAFDIQPEQLEDNKKISADARISIANILKNRGVTEALIGQVLNRKHNTVSDMLRNFKNLYKVDKAFKNINDTIWIS